MSIKHFTCPLFILAMLQGSCVYAADGYCTPVNGTASLSYDMGNQNITNPDDNVPGTILAEKSLTTGSETTTVNCSCTGGPYTHVWIWGDTTLTNPVSAGGLNYYDIPGNEYIQVSTQVNTVTNGYQSVPFGPKPNSSTVAQYKCNTNINLQSGGSYTGGQIKVSVRIKKSFVGQSFINHVLIASTYWTIGDTGGSSHGPVATTNTYLDGSITVPQNCVINAGTQVVVDMGSFYQGDFKNVGQKPEHYTPKTFNVPIQCNDLSASANLTLRIQGTPSAGVPNALQSDNADVGVIVTDSSGTPLVPNDSTSVIPLQLDSSYRTNVTLHAYPVGTTGDLQWGNLQLLLI